MTRTIAGSLLRNAFHQTEAGKNSSRRSFIKKSALAAAALALPTWQCSTKNPIISIIGGGLAGLRASQILDSAGKDHVLYEASGRTGGRVLTVENAVVDGSYVDFGAEFIDTTHQEVLSLIKEFDLELVDLRADPLHPKTFYFEGRILTEPDIRKAIDPFAPAIAMDINSLPRELHYKNADLFRNLDFLSIPDYLTKVGMSGWLKNLIELVMAAEYGMSASEQSCINMLGMLTIPDPNDVTYDLFGNHHEVLKLKGGNQKLSEALTNKTTKNIRLEHTLKSIRKKENGYMLEFETPGGIQEAYTDLILIAVPFPVLRNIKRDFSFPERKERSIKMAGFGNTCKTALGFNLRAWRNQGHQGYTFSELNNTVLWDSSQGIEIEQGSLTFVTAGKDADDAFSMSYRDFENKWLSGADKVYPGLEKSYNQKISKICWGMNPLSGESYTSYRTGQWSEFSGVESEPFENIFFAGEHCSVEHQGYMNGALESGRLAAEAIISLL